VSKAVHPILRLLGARIRSLRAQRRLSQEALADLAAIDRSYMSGVERGLRNISVLHAVRIANALEVSLSELLRLGTGAERLPSSMGWMVVEDNVALSAAESAEWEVGRYLSLG
jgi:transcriptional regulator with XRE-family HTH domain